MSRLTRNLVAVLATVALAGTAACSADEGSNGTDGASGDLKVGFAMPDASVTYWTAYVNGVEEKAAELGVEVQFSDAQNDTNTQLDQVNSLLVSGVDGIVLPPVDTTSLLGAVDAANENDIPLITSNRALEMEYTGVGGASPMIHVGFNDVEIGRQQGEMVADLCEGNDNCEVALLMQPLGSTPQLERTEGFKEVVESHDNITIVTEQSDNLDSNLAMELTRTILQQHPDLDILATQYDDTAVAAAQAITEAGRASDIETVGIGGSKLGIDAVEAGDIFGTVWVSPRSDGAVALEAMVAILRGDEITGLETINDRPTLPVGLVQVTAENAADHPGEW